MTRKIEVQIVADSAQFERAFKTSAGTLNTFERDVGRSGRGAAAASLQFRGLGRNVAFASAQFLGAAGFVEVVKSAVEQASSLEDQIRRTDAVFKTSAGTVKAWSKDSAEALGLSQSAALDAANTIGTLLTNIGKTPAQAAGMSKQMVQLASDMAAFKKVKPEVALQALESALQGRTRSLKQFGITIDAAALKEEAYKTGVAQTTVVTAKVQAAETQRAIAQAKLAKAEQDYGAGTTQVKSAILARAHAEDALKKAQEGSTGQLTAAQKALAAYNLILDKAKSQQGTFAKSGDELNVVEQKLHAHLQDVEATLGQALLPIMEKYGNELDQWIEKEQKNGNLQRDLNGAVKLLAAGVHDATVIAHAAGEAFHFLSDAVGGDKDAVYALVGAWAAYKATVAGIKFAELITSLGGTGTAVGGIETAAGSATAEVSGLRAALLGLSAPEVLAGIGLVGGALYEMLKFANNGATQHTVTNAQGVPSGTIITENGQQFYAPAGERGHKIPLAQAEAAGLVPNDVTNNGGQVPHYGGGRLPNTRGAKTTYSQSDVYGLLVANGVPPDVAANLATISAHGEDPSGNAAALNNNARTGDYSVGLFQENFLGRMGVDRTRRYAPQFGLDPDMPTKAFVAWLGKHPSAQAKIAYDIYNAQGYAAWTTAKGLGITDGGGTGGAVTGPLTVGTKKNPKDQITRGDALLGAGLGNAIGIYGTKASSALTANDTLYWLQLEEKDLEKAHQVLKAKADQGSKKQQAATAAETQKIAKQLDTVQGEIAKARKAIADERFATQVKSQVGRFVGSLAALDSKYASLMLRTQFDTGKALEDDYSAIAKNLDDQKTRIEGEVAKLKSERAGKDKAQKAAIDAQISRLQSGLTKVNDEIKSNLAGQYQALQAAFSTAQSKVGSSWSTYQGEILNQFATNMQKQLAALAADPRFFQNGALTDSEAALAGMQTADQQGSLNDAIAAAQQQLADDVTAQADAATIAADNKSIVAANRQLTEYELGVKAEQERNAANAAYADAQQALTDKLNEQQGELSKTLTDFGQRLQDGTVSLSDLQGWLDGANQFGVNFGISLQDMDKGSALTASDFTDLSKATSDLQAAFVAMKQWIAKETGTAFLDPGSGLAQRLSQRLHAPLPADVPTVAVIGTSGTPGSGFGDGNVRGTTVQVTIEKVVSLTRSPADARELAKAVAPHLEKIVGYTR